MKLLREIAGGALALLLLGATVQAGSAQAPEVPTITSATVSFASSPFLDQSDVILGIENGWFEEVGITITPGPTGLVLPSAERAANLITGTIDVAATAVYNLLPSFGTNRNLKIFFQKDLYQGYRIMAQPNKGYKSVEEFVADGQTFDEAIVSAARQLMGGTIAYLSEPSREQFVSLVYKKAGLTEEEIGAINTINVDDSQTIGLMLSGRADFQMSGAPAMVELTKRGYKPLITAVDLVRASPASASSPELVAVGKVGWGTTDEYLAANEDTLLRMVSVGFRIASFVKENPDEALAIAIPFLNSIAGSQLTVEDGKWLYDVVHPYFTFDEQRAWYADTTSQLYYTYEIGARINDAEQSGILPAGEVTPDSIMVADKLYWKMVELQASAGRKINEAERFIAAAAAAGKHTPQATDLLEQASAQFGNYNFLDADRFADAALEWATYEQEQP